MDWREAWEPYWADLSRRTGGAGKDWESAYSEVFRQGYEDARATVAAERDAALAEVEHERQQKEHWIKSGIEYAETAQTMVANLTAERDAARREVERLHQALCDIQFDLINCSQAAGSGACEHLKDAIKIVVRTLSSERPTK